MRGAIEHTPARAPCRFKTDKPYSIYSMYFMYFKYFMQPVFLVTFMVCPGNQVHNTVEMVGSTTHNISIPLRICAHANALKHYSHKENVKPTSIRHGQDFYTYTCNMENQRRQAKEQKTYS